MSGVGPLPEPGEWPCQTPPRLILPQRLVATLYRLLRDEVAPGDLEQVLIEIGRQEGQISYTNPHLAALARAHASYLLGAS